MACGGFGSPIIVDCIISENLAMQTGGGIGCGRDSSPTINNCTISGNTAISDGGGIFSLDSNATITNCTISENWSWLYGGGIFCEYLQPVITNCLISGNWAFIGGGGIDCFVSNPTITNCTISNNTSISYHGGGIYCGSSSAKIMNCTISGNSAYLNGGGVHCHGGGQGSKNVEVTNCTFGLNSASRDGSSISCESSTIMMVRNCILWGDLASQGAEIFIGGGFSSLSISYSNVQGGQSGSQVYVNNALIWGDGNIDADPFFTDPENEDYHLKSQAGRWDPTSESWIIDDVTSPCIDAGDPNNPVGLEPMPNGGIINIGAYGGTEQASKSSELKSLLLPYVGFIFSSDVEIAESFKSLLEAYSCAVDLIGLDELAQSTLVDYDLIIVGNDTGRLRRWGDILSAAVIESSGNPIIGLGEGGYAFFGKLELSIGYPHGWHGDNNSVYIVPYRTLEDMPYPISLPLDRVLQLYTETRHVGIYLPSIPEDVITIGREAGNRSHYPFVLEDNRYFLWGFSGPPESMTESGKLLFINTIILTANVAWDIESREQHMSQEVFK